MKTGVSSGLRISVAIATAGRPEILAEAVAELTKQSRAPNAIYVSAPSAADVGRLQKVAIPLDLTLGVRGLCIQRNAIIARATHDDIIVFFDDDFFPGADYLHQLETLFVQNPDVVLATGNVIADGIVGPGLSVERARAVLAHDTVCLGRNSRIEEIYNGYGCNMAIRLATLRQHDILFDEALPLYGWLEDVDFSRRLALHGRVVKVAAARGVHLGYKRGRQSGTLLGYSQIANPLYLARKGTLAWPRALKQIGRNVGANCLNFFAPEPYVDRRGRVAGHVRAIMDLVMGRLDPRRVLELSDVR
jgi:hypothetical protein